MVIIIALEKRKKKKRKKKKKKNNLCTFEMFIDRRENLILVAMYKSLKLWYYPPRIKILLLVLLF